MFTLKSRAFHWLWIYFSKSWSPYQALKCIITFMPFTTSVQCFIRFHKAKNRPIKNKLHAAAFCFHQRRLCMCCSPITMLLHVSKIVCFVHLSIFFSFFRKSLRYVYHFILSPCSPSPFLNKHKRKKSGTTAMTLSAVWSSLPPPSLPKILQFLAMWYSQ